MESSEPMEIEESSDFYYSEPFAYNDQAGQSTSYFHQVEVSSSNESSGATIFQDQIEASISQGQVQVEASVPKYQAEVSINNYMTEASPSKYQAEVSPSEYQTEASPFEYQVKASTSKYQAEASTSKYQAETSPFEYQVEPSTSKYQPEASPFEYQAEASTSKYQTEASTSKYQTEASTSKYQAEACASQDQVKASTSKAETLVDLLADVPKEVLTGCDMDDVARNDYKAALFPRKRPPDAPPTEPTPSVFHEEEIFDPLDNFYFESDHLALKGNTDYQNILRVIVTLQAQRTQAIKDLDTLLLAKKEALADPIGFVAKMQNGDLPEYPGPQTLPEIPEIDWSKYSLDQPDNNMRPQTRHAKTVPHPKDLMQQESDDKFLVRGRVYDESKPETFNKLWTTDEQRRLEELLIEYPPEEVEMRRWTKIANALGNRTPKQVSSRVQKYFLKLTKAGLPIPGRGPKAKSEPKKSSRQKNFTSFRKSTFFPHEQILDELKREPLQQQFHNLDDMKREYQDESLTIDEIKQEVIQEESDDDEMAAANTRTVDDPMMRQIELLRQVKMEKDKNSEESNYRHLGSKCFICGEEPIKGIRWHCEECQEEIVDLCSDCAVAQLEAEDPLHPSTHKLTAVRPVKYSGQYDADYLPQNFNTTSYNYLDPNFLPE